jgi:hypothetical protein
MPHVVLPPALVAAWCESRCLGHLHAGTKHVGHGTPTQFAAATGNEVNNLAPAATHSMFALWQVSASDSRVASDEKMQQSRARDGLTPSQDWQLS